MCACEPGFTCSRCRDTTQDDPWVRDFGDEPETPRETELRLAAETAREQRGIRA